MISITKILNKKKSKEKNPRVFTVEEVKNIFYTHGRYSRRLSQHHVHKSCEDGDKSPNGSSGYVESF
ncbi:hypothetical protein ACFLZF_00525 [Nanoarchaeota archaeon]